jgi:transcriptional repressor NrdR
MVVKKDGTCERFDRQAINGLLKACEKRPVSVAARRRLWIASSRRCRNGRREISTTDVGAFVMEELKKLDKVAFVRFASVYRDFRDIGESGERAERPAQRKRLHQGPECPRR